ncbi:unnamed protein product [Auanema sp. JU1783]|nr:unnamed protein product [Auanema sp. JU1783]
MVEPASDTSDMQRFDEMFIHLTPRAASTPFSVCHDTEGNIWVASKGGLFKFDPERRTTLWMSKNPFPKKMAGFPQVVCHKDTIIYTSAEDQLKTTEMKFYTLNGELKTEQYIDGLLFSLVITENGDIYFSKQPEGKDSSIYKTTIECPIDCEKLCSLEEAECFQTLCILDENRLMCSIASRPVNLYSKQRVVIINTTTGEIMKSFGEAGKEDEKIFFPRSIRPYKDDIVMMDKTGRFMRFTKEGEYLALLAKVDAFLANSFCIKDDKALIAFSGVVYDKHMRSIVDDWLEWINLDGSSWKQQREEAKAKEAEAKKAEA